MGLQPAEPKSRFDHSITTDYTGGVVRDGHRVRISVDLESKFVHVGCTRISFEAMEKLYDLFRPYRSSGPRTVTLQEGCS